MRPLVSFRVSAAEFESIEGKAAAAGLKRAEYAQAKVIAPDQSCQIEELEQQVRELTQRLSQAEQHCVDLKRLAMQLQERLQETQREKTATESSFWNKLTRNIGNR